MSRPPATPEQKAAVRLKIRQAAVEVYTDEGVGGVSIRSIAKRADVSVGTIYTYFGNLQGLMESLWSAPVARYTDQMKQTAASIEDPIERLRALMHIYIDFAYSNPEIYRGVFLHVSPLTKEDMDKTPAEDAIFASLAIEAIQDGQALKTIKASDPKTTAMMIWGGLHGCYALPNNFGRMAFDDTKEVLHLFVETIISALKS